MSAVFATVFGVVTSLGFGAMQINSGLHHLYGIPTNTTTILIIIAVVTVLFLASSISGVDKGIQILSRFNFLLAALALLFILFLGPTSYILDVFVSSLGRYVNHFVEMSLATYPFQGQEWAKNWTIFYWAWWIAWAPFVGLFVARISRGRTIKEFVLGVLLVPSLLVFLWFSAFGGSALHLQLQGVNIAQVATADAPIALFVFFDHFPLGDIMSALTSVLLVVFFVTSADSATYVLGMLTSQGNLFPPTSKKVIWGLAESLIAALLLLAGGLEALQQMVINAALPFTFVMVLLCYNLWRGLAEETAPTELWLSDL
jgi:glycine betaine transporter